MSGHKGCSMGYSQSNDMREIGDEVDKSLNIWKKFDRPGMFF